MRYRIVSQGKWQTGASLRGHAEKARALGELKGAIETFVPVAQGIPLASRSNSD